MRNKKNGLKCIFIFWRKEAKKLRETGSCFASGCEITKRKKAKERWLGRIWFSDEFVD
jgi:hypothetical protein